MSKVRGPIINLEKVICECGHENKFLINSKNKTFAHIKNQHLYDIKLKCEKCDVIYTVDVFITAT